MRIRRTGITADGGMLVKIPCGSSEHCTGGAALEAASFVREPSNLPFRHLGVYLLLVQPTTRRGDRDRAG
jgi:hypothetical protein